MKLTTKNLLILLLIVSAAFAVTQLTKRSGKSKSLRDELVSVDTDKVSKVEVIGIKGSATLSKEDDTWQVTLGNGQTKPAKGSSVDAMLNTLNTIKPGRLAAKDEEKWKDYAVDSTGTRVKVFEEEDLITDIVLGRFGVEGQRSFYTFVRLFEEENVYVANDFMKMSISENANDYRDNVVGRIVGDSLVSVRFSYPDSSFSLVKGEKWMTGEGQEADSTSVANYLSDLSFLTSKEFYDADLNIKPSHEIVFSFSDDSNATFSGFTLPGSFVIKSSENTVEAFSDQQIKEKLFKGISAFQPTTD